MLQSIKAVARTRQLPLDIREDHHFFGSVRDFRVYAKGRQSLIMEYFYREQRKRHRVLVQGSENGGKSQKPACGQWSFDADNRESFGADGPGQLPQRLVFEPDAITREVIELAEVRFADHPGHVDSFAWPVTREQALQSLQVFIIDRLPLFGRYQDAMWPRRPVAVPRAAVGGAEPEAAESARGGRGRRSRLARRIGAAGQCRRFRSPDPRLARTRAWHLLDPDARLRTPQRARRTGRIAGVVWTDMACLRDAIEQTLSHGYANHIQRLMVTGLYALMLGVKPQQVHAWYLAVYVDAVEWVELPNMLGMSQYADGGLMGSKPYIATGKYIQRMSSHCKGCRYDPAERSGDDACPFTTLYWDFLMRHEAMLAEHPRMKLQVKNLARLDDSQRRAVRQRAAAIRRGEVGKSVA